MTTYNPLTDPAAPLDTAIHIVTQTRKNLLAAINDSLGSGGFKSQVSQIITICFDLPPIQWRDIYANHEKYHADYQKVPGVLEDVGQGEGYAFQVDAEDYTVQSERKLLQLITKTRNAESPR